MNVLGDLYDTPKRTTLNGGAENQKRTTLNGGASNEWSGVSANAGVDVPLVHELVGSGNMNHINTEINTVNSNSSKSPLKPPPASISELFKVRKFFFLVNFRNFLRFLKFFFATFWNLLRFFKFFFNEVSELFMIRKVFLANVFRNEFLESFGKKGNFILRI